MAASENPLAHTRVVRTASGTRARAAVLLPRALHPELPARVGGVRHRRRARQAPPVGVADARAPLVIGLAAWRSLREDRPVHEVESASSEVLSGGSGFVGPHLAAVFAGARRAGAGARRARPDRRGGATLRSVGASAPDAIVHAAILNDLARDGRRPARGTAYVGATRNVVDAAAGAHVVLVSTDWVFDGTQGRRPRTRRRTRQPVRLPQGGERAGRHRARARGTVARIAGVQGVHRAPAARAPPGPRLRLPRRVARRGAARASRSRSGRAGHQHGRHADARHRRGRADLARARAAHTGVLHCCGGEHADRARSPPRGRRLRARPELLRTGPPPEPPAARGPVRHAARRDRDRRRARRRAARPRHAAGAPAPREEEACATT